MGGDDELVADVVVVGFGAAGACAAIEAARAGADVIVLDRFGGGGSSALSGGVVYAGGGTSVQRAAGVTDTPEAMFEYLRREVGDVVSAATLRRFCDGSVDMVAWLADLGVPFEASLCPYKTSYPSNRHYLYYSGSEAAGGFRDAAPPAPRGHRARGRGISGGVLFAQLARGARAAGVRVLTQTSAAELVTGPDGRVVGVDCRRLTGRPAATHRWLSKYAAKPGIYYPPLRRALHPRAEALERRHARPLRIHARHGVVLAAGGFIENRALLRQHAPAFRGGLALGTPGDDGSGIRLGTAAGAATAELGSVSVWRFISPPSAFLGSVLVDAAGRRVCDESRYGAALGDALIARHGGRGWLLVDAGLVRDARRQLRSQTVWFQRMQTEYLLRSRRVDGATLDEVAGKAGVDAAGLRATVAAHNDAAAAGLADPAGKPAEFVRPLVQPPYALLDISIGPSMYYPCPMLTLGGLVVDEDTGAVLRQGGEPVHGLFAAGRSAVGICSRSYVSGLSLADCIFSGRRAGRSATDAATGLDTNENVF
ncbi:MAG: 3-oxo-5alpha-steroid 4-dehydrogenase [Pseudonocardiales bacterium]|nr:3-oxo-5alpha-steroid 4-dehydrogenase [Pseudonocardiales bacterium]MDT7686385.1 3-oxo-5alpha-steroid 4-dehydrogenase [Pseudonocardiales bacterium]